MQRLILFGVAGFVAQLVDGAIGMGYGLTSSSMLLAMGITPAVASASIHLAEIATTAASGVSHFKLGNVDRSLVRTLIVPGAVGAFVGACFLSNIPGKLVAPFIAVGLLLLGVYVMAQYLLRPARRAPGSLKVSAWKMAPLAIVAGFFDSVGGGGWGPISTPVLLAHRGSDPRKVVGSVDASEFFVTVAGTLGFVIALGLDDINWQWVGIFAASGLLAAPLAAWLVRLMPVQLLGVVVGGAIILTNSRTLMMYQSVSSEVATLVYGILLAGWALALVVAGRRIYRSRRAVLSEAL